MANDFCSDTYQAPRWPTWLRMPWAFHLFDKLRDAWRDRAERTRFLRRNVPETAARVLVVRDRGFGDVLQITTILNAIRKRYSATTLDFLTSPLGKTILEADPRVDHVYVTDDPPPTFADNYDLVINLHIFDNSPAAKRAVLQIPEEKLLGRTFRDDRDEEWIGYLAGSCWLRKYCRIADVPFAPDFPLSIHIAHDAKWDEEVAAFVEKTFPGNTRPLAICLGGMDWRRNYTIPYLETLVSAFENEYPVLLVGLRSDRSDEEQKQLADMLARHPSVMDLSDRQSLRELLFTLEYAGALLTADTGPVHMAIGVGTPLVALFGHTPGTQLLGPVTRSDRHAVVTPPSGCRFCGYRFRESCMQEHRAECMERFDLDEICAEVRRLFKK